ncbi:MAG: hypothetical protein JWM23_582 [Microbacteriaceae bacterium]|nr:hypothetical protein [Microbacteriaceae bacterium]
MSDYNEGDLIEAVKGKRRVQDVLTAGGGSIFRNGPYLGEPSIFGPSSIESYENLGYTITVIEKAKPPLPIEPGVYLSSLTDRGPWVFKLDERGDWILLNTNSLFPVGDGHLERHAPFTKLEPVAETVERVLAEVRNRAIKRAVDNMTIRYLVLENIADEFAEGGL